MGRPIFSPPPKKKRLHVYSWQGKVGCVFPRQFTICTTVFPHPITWWTRLILNHFFPTPRLMIIRCLPLSVWRKSGPAQFFPSPSTKYTCITDVEKFEVGEKTDRVGKKPTGFFFFLPGKKMTSQFLSWGRNGPAWFFPGERLAGEKNWPLHL